VNDWSNEEIDNPLYADDHNFCKVEWTCDGSKVDPTLYAGSNLGKGKDIFAEAIKHRAADRVDHPAENARVAVTAANRHYRLNGKMTE
jgi:hypothetical protein